MLCTLLYTRAYVRYRYILCTLLYTRAYVRYRYMLCTLLYTRAYVRYKLMLCTLLYTRAYVRYRYIYVAYPRCGPFCTPVLMSSIRQCRVPQMCTLLYTSACQVQIYAMYIRCLPSLH